MSTVDFIEIYLTCNENACFPEHVFNNLFDYLRTKPLKNVSSFFKKTVYKEYCKNLILEQVFDTNIDFHTSNIPTKESVNSYIPVTLPEESPLCELTKNKDVIVNFYKKIGHSLCSFPSTNKIYDSLCEQRSTFKVNNRIYLNLCKVEYMSELGCSRYYVTVHYQYKENCDVMNDIELLKQLYTLQTTINTTLLSMK
jgi:hypothetical protein